MGTTTSTLQHDGYATCITIVYFGLAIQNSQVFGVRFESLDGGGVNARAVVARFARSHLWGICAAVSAGSQCVVARFTRLHLWGICAAFTNGSQCVVARFARRHLTGFCAADSVGS